MQQQINPNRINMYTCEACGQSIITQDLMEGTTPFIVACHCTPACKGKMYSHLYRVFDPDGKMRPTHEWYKPVLIDSTWSPAVADHVNKGGLLLRVAASHQHLKRGTFYRRQVTAILQTKTSLPDLSKVIIYHDLNRYFVRSEEEFNDGRFQQV